ncbi:GNAT family N-acetyltransferase [Kushneria phosphatilytica]|uniref:GNAT family N-acetyltransferase n=1 Tax=Kushneria phosphatilytica TaxID=657387 RepID=A0A1S1NYY5_9GAMM|nr:GNAT family N-acetyltransferase [Kushneria phosphatilytica]OHV12891.1 GNAT family N-acetyltransferase [Kushneria phosphatilytica]QEL10750.1 GNAT family N-acetyltransferase [Kushneria phosphatilytica]
MTLLLRSAEAGDLKALWCLERACFEHDGFSRRQLAHLLRRANARTLVLLDPAGTPCGYGTLLFRRNSRIVRLYSFCIHPAQRGGGHGRRMLTALEELAKEAGGEQLQLEVRADNRAAIALYRRMGYRALGWLDSYYEDGCGGWKMSRRLQTPEGVESVEPTSASI